jgi:hypothetical protein
MKRLKRVLFIGACTLGLLLASLFYLGPVALSFYAARKAAPVTRIVPFELKDNIISQVPGLHLSCIGYDFEVPWTDLDESKTQFFPKNKPVKTTAVLTFRSGLRMMVTSFGPGESAKMWENEFKVPQQNVEAIFGAGSSSSDYIFMNTVLNFTPDKMHHWSLTPSIFAREEALLVAKSLMPSSPAKSGLFNIKTGDYLGFQQGNLDADHKGALISLFSKDDGVEILFALNESNAPDLLTQPDVNRVIQTLHRTPISEVANSRN